MSTLLDRRFDHKSKEPTLEGPCQTERSQKVSGYIDLKMVYACVVYTHAAVCEGPSKTAFGFFPNFFPTEGHRHLLGLHVGLGVLHLGEAGSRPK